MAARAALCDDSRVSRRVVIVDDHAPFRASARRLLELEGWTVVGEAADGASAYETVERHITNLYGKIDAHNRADATAFAFRHGLL